MSIPISTSPLSWEKEPSKSLVRLAGPMTLSLLSTSVASLVDTWFVGRLGAIPLAAVGLGGVVTFTILSFGLAVFSAAKVKVGEALGGGDTDRVARSLGIFLRLSLYLGLASTAFALWFSFSWLSALSADPLTGELAATYMSIRCLSYPFVLFSTAISSWLQAQGKPRVPMQATLIGSGANILLNTWFLFGLGWGVQAIAWATVLAHAIELAALLGLARLSHFGLRSSTNREAWSAFRTGFPTGCERVFDMAAFAAVPLLLAQVSPVEVAAHQITLQLCLLSFLPQIALTDATSILVSQAVGAHRFAPLRKLARASLLLGAIYALALLLIFYLGRFTLVRTFTDDPRVLTIGGVTLMWAALLQLINTIYNLCKGILRGLSAFRLVAVVTVGVAWVITPPLTYLLGVRMNYGAAGAWAVLCFEVSVGTVILIFGLRRHPLFRRVERAAHAY